MRLCYLNTSSLPSNQPGPLQTVQTANAVASPDTPVWLIHRSSGTSREEILDHYDIEPDPNLHLRGVPALTVEWLPGTIRSKVKWGSFLLGAALISILHLRYRDTVYYARDSILGIWLGVLSAVSGRPYVFESHALPGAFHENWTEITGSDPLPDWKVRLERLKGETALRLATGLVVIAENLERDLSEQYDLPATLVAHDGAPKRLVDSTDDTTESDARDSGVTIGYIGSRFTEMRNPQVIIESLTDLPETDDALIVGGREADVESIRTAAADRSVEHRTTLTGYLPQSEALDRLSNADILVFPYTEVAEETNRSPLKLFDYMGLDAAIVAADIRPARELLDESCAVFFDPADHDELVEAVTELRADPSRRRQLSENARTRLEQFTWESRGDRIREFLVRLCDCGHGSP